MSKKRIELSTVKLGTQFTLPHDPDTVYTLTRVGPSSCSVKWRIPIVIIDKPTFKNKVSEFARMTEIHLYKPGAQHERA